MYSLGYKLPKKVYQLGLVGVVYDYKKYLMKKC